MEKKKNWPRIIKAYGLANALSHNGVARIEVVIQKLFREGLRKNEIKNILPEVKKIVSEINSWDTEKQKQEFMGLEKIIKKRKEKVGLPELPRARKGKVIMRLAPFPSGPLHIGNAKTYLLNDEYCKKYKGRLLLVIDDTIGTKEKAIVKDAYKLIVNGLEWLKIKFDKKIYYKSDRLKIYYKYAEKLIKKRKAYVCFCSQNDLREKRERKEECKHRNHSVEENLKFWENMLKGKYKEGQATLRLKTSMEHKNPAFRDRVLFRISEREHPRIGKKFKVWPLLEFSWAIDDHLLKISHVLRGKELMIETEMEKYIFDVFRWPKPVFIHSGLLQLEGIKISKSKSQREVLTKKFIGWDDPRTWSLQSLKRRGIKPEAIRNFCLKFGLTQTEVTVPIDVLYSENKKFIESSNRYFFIQNPERIKIKNAPKIKARLPLHPSLKKGYRILKTENCFYVQKEDKPEKDKIYRFMYLFNFKDKKFLSREHDEKLNAKMIHWLPCDNKQIVKTEILMPDGKIVRGLAEHNIENLEIGTIIQFERFGFCRLDSVDKKTKTWKFWFTQK